MISTNKDIIIIAETSPIILYGLTETLKKIKEFHPKIISVDTRDSLFDTIATEKVSLLIINPTFTGLINPDEIRRKSNNQDLKIFAIEIGKLSKNILSLYDNHIHVTDETAELRNKVVSAFNFNSSYEEEKETLSMREKEIISYVVKGFTNQEMAEKLFISVHTVMTHRRNIARKLQIHSATGLTIYAIVNKIVDLSEIKI